MTLIATVGLVERSAAQNTINVTTTLQGITDASHCSLQEAIYSAEFGGAVAIGSTDPDATYSTGCSQGRWKRRYDRAAERCLVSVQHSLGWGCTQSLRAYRKEMVGTWGLEPQTSTVSRFSYPIPPTTSANAGKLLSPSKHA